MLDRSGRNSQSQQAYGASSRPVTMDDVMNSEVAEGALRADTQNALRSIAEETSGALIANTNELGAPLAERVTADLASYYEIGYTPPPTPPDGHFRAITVKLARPGVTVHSRSGYFALPDSDSAPLLPYEVPMLSALDAVPPPHPFEYSVAAFRFGQSPLAALCASAHAKICLMVRSGELWMFRTLRCSDSSLANDEPKGRPR